MKKQQIKKIIVERCPNIPQLRRILSEYEIKRNTRVLLPQVVVQKAERDADTQREVLKKSFARWSNRTQSDNKRIDVIFQKAPDYKDLEPERQKEIRQDMLFCRFAYGFMPEEYVCYRLDEKTPAERRDFISESDHMSFCYKMNDPVDINIFNDKMRTYNRFGKYYCRQIISVNGANDFERFSNYVEAHPVFVKKQVYESCGNSIEKIDMHVCRKSEREVFHTFLAEGKVVLEELVEQGDATAIFNKSSVNTIRCITFNTKHGIKAPYCFMKIGRRGAFVDNGGAGGILVGIDNQTGMTNTVGYDEMRTIYEKHPDSGVDFIGHQLPEWEKMILICKEMASQIPTVRFIGWDMAYTQNNGWVVIEGNGMSQFIGPQTIWQRGIREETMCFMHDMDIR